MQIRYVKGHGPYAAGETREAGTDEALYLLAHGIVEPAGVAEVRKATAPPPSGKRTAATKNNRDEG